MSQAPEIMTAGLNEFQLRLNRQFFEKFETDFTQWRASRPRRPKPKRRWRSDDAPSDRRRPENELARDLFDFVSWSIEQLTRDVTETVERFRDFQHTLSLATSEEERRSLILRCASDLGASGWQLKKDEAAFDRWFDEEAVADRFKRKTGEDQQRIEFYLQRLGRVTARIMNLAESVEGIPRLWSRLKIEKRVNDILDSDLDVRVHRAAIDFLACGLAGMPKKTATSVVEEEMVAQLSELASDHEADTWMQTKSLEALVICSPDQALSIAIERLTNPKNGDDLFFRRRAVGVITNQVRQEPQLLDQLDVMRKDPSPFVRQSLCDLVWKCPVSAASYWLRHLAVDDEDPKVRAFAIYSGLRFLHRTELHQSLLETLVHSLQNEEDAFVRRAALRTSAEWLRQYHLQFDPDVGRRDQDRRWKSSDQLDEIRSFFRLQLLPQVREIQTNCEHLPSRRFASLAAEQIQIELHQASRKLLHELRRRLADLQPGKSISLRRDDIGPISEDRLGRALSVMAQNEFGFDVNKTWRGYRISKGPRFGFRLWRLIAELRRPATDKRQAYRHTIGRVSHATIRVPSAILAELSETKVPGEPLFLPNEAGYRPYLPLVDDFISALDVSYWYQRTIKFYTAQGITFVTAPPWYFRRVWAWLRLSFGFHHYARLRNAATGQAEEPYVDSLRRLGFKVRFQPHTDSENSQPIEDESVQQFFSPLLAVGVEPYFDFVKRLTTDFVSYLPSLYENSLAQLLVFLFLFLAAFIGRHFYMSITIRKSRSRTPFSIGGWGTRGKSGTERLKGALINGLGYGLVSKSTGCEAMFLQSHAYGDVLEFPLFRPYDKATIWEHRDVMRMAAKFDSSVFLWECMGLTPAYVDVLQRQWSRDDIGTITNTFPDHEDLQGPAGWNVATTIAGFIPESSRVITTEQQMLPILRATARQVDTELESVDWLDSGTLTDDVMNRFPYQEHPDNVALTLALARTMGIDADYALKAMADNLIPDLGVLKTYPVARVDHRELEFTNGMSANERYGCMGNWERTGFATHDSVVDPTTYICTVVNNRADRVPRSKVFASILVNDISADRHFLIGSNLKGFRGFLDEAWNEYAQQLHLCSSDEFDRSQAESTFHSMSLRMRQVVDRQQIEASVLAMLDAVREQPAKNREHAADFWNDPDGLASTLHVEEIETKRIDDILENHRWMLRSFEEYEEMLERIRTLNVADSASLREPYRELLRTWFNRKFVVINDYYAKGDVVVARIAKATPLGFRARIMGLQNIKGTGLDFVYRWQAWDQCHAACETLSAENKTVARRGLDTLSAMPEFGLLCEHHVRESIDRVKKSEFARREEDISQLDAVLEQLGEPVPLERRFSVKRDKAKSSWVSRLCDWFIDMAESLLDVNDAVRRRKMADQIYRDLEAGRISRARAIKELRAVNTRQKGGWLKEQLKSEQLESKVIPAVHESPAAYPASKRSTSKKMAASPTQNPVAEAEPK